MSLATTIGGIPLACCVYNASGPNSGHVTDLVNVGKSQSGAVLSKSATLVKQSGNELPRLKKIEMGGGICEASINSEGLPNAGIDYYISSNVVEGVKGTGKPYIVSISGLKLADNLEMLSRTAAAHAAGGNIAGVELNLACPNIPGKPTIAYDFEQMADILKQVTNHEAFKASGLPLGVKLAPYFDMPHYAMAADIINAHKDRIRFVVTMNTIGNALLVDGESEMAMIAPKSGFGGLGGGLTKQVALANVRQLSQRLAPEIDIVGVGGVASGMDAFELILCGASAVQVATRHWTEGPKCFDRIAKELEGIMRRKGYKTLADFRGKLKEFDRKLSKPAIDGSEAATASGKAFSWQSLLLAGVLPLVLILLQREMQRM
jgi:dihydroorotate dehydrogenase (fumarate)